MLAGERVHAGADSSPPLVVKLTAAVGGVSFALPTSATVTLHVQGDTLAAMRGGEEHARLVLVG